MTDKPILFSGPMIRAILDDRKTQTRRVLKNTKDGFETPKFRCGDRLWVRETFQVSGLGWGKKPKDAFVGKAHYKADPVHGWHDYWGTWHPSIHMPRWASRITLVVTDVRVQRLQDITAEDAEAEGLLCGETEGGDLVFSGLCQDYPIPPAQCHHWPEEAFAGLWNSINEKRGFGWSENPWVAAYTFEVHRCNIDQMGAVR